MEIVGGLFIAGLLLWWIIKSDLKVMRWKERMREESAKRDALSELDHREAETIKRQGRAFSDRRLRVLQRCQNECRKAQDGRGRVPISTVSRIMNWREWQGADGKIEYGSYGSVADAAGREVYAHDSQQPWETNPFPKQISEGFFWADDLINWLEQEIRDCREANS
jgi:hypothetical protein